LGLDSCHKKCHDECHNERSQEIINEINKLNDELIVEQAENGRRIEDKIKSEDILSFLNNERIQWLKERGKLVGIRPDVVNLLISTGSTLVDAGALYITISGGVTVGSVVAVTILGVSALILSTVTFCLAHHAIANYLWKKSIRDDVIRTAILLGQEIARRENKIKQLEKDIAESEQKQAKMMNKLKELRDEWSRLYDEYKECYEKCMKRCKKRKKDYPDPCDTQPCQPCGVSEGGGDIPPGVIIN